MNLENHIVYYMGIDCKVSKEMLPFRVNLSEKFSLNSDLANAPKIKMAREGLELARANLELEKSNSYPSLQIGPSYEYSKVNINQTTTVGLTLTMDLPFYNINGGGRAKAAKDILNASINLKNNEREGRIDLNSWIMKYDQYRKSLNSVANNSALDKKHKKIEALFKRGIISTSLVIESHRQLIEFTTTRFEFELGAVEAFWNIHNINGKLNTTKL